MSPRVTVVMPVYNARPYLQEAIASVLRQTMGDFELLLGDNVSTDDSMAIAESFSDARIRIIRHERNYGIFGNLNRLFGEAKSELVKILCADDVMEPNCLERQVAFMLARPELGFARCLGTQEVAGIGPKGPYRYENQLPTVIYPAAADLSFFTFGNILGNLTNVICRKEAVAKAGFFNQGFPYAGDMEMWIRTARLYPFGVQREALVYVREHPNQGSVTLNKHNELVGQIDQIFTDVYNRLPSGTKSLARYHASVVVMVAHAGNAIRLLRQGNWAAFHKYAVRRSYAYHWSLCLFLYYATGSMRWGYNWSTRHLLRALSQLNQPATS